MQIVCTEDRTSGTGSGPLFLDALSPEFPLDSILILNLVVVEIGRDSCTCL